jgi:hypothetical protein
VIETDVDLIGHTGGDNLISSAGGDRLIVYHGDDRIIGFTGGGSLIGSTGGDSLVDYTGYDNLVYQPNQVTIGINRASMIFGCTDLHACGTSTSDASDSYIFNMKRFIFRSRGVCSKSVKYVGSHNGIHDMTRAGEPRDKAASLVRTSQQCTGVRVF